MWTSSYFSFLVFVLRLDGIHGLVTLRRTNFKVEGHSRKRNLYNASEENRHHDERLLPALSVAPSSSCPVSKTFPRYRIDMTTQRRNANKERNRKPLVDISWLTAPWTRPMQSRLLEQRLGKEDGLSVGTGKDGIAAISFLWDQATTLLDTDRAPSAGALVIALPDSSRPLVQNFVEIMNWMNANVDVGTIGPNLLKAELIEVPGLEVPAVRMSRMVESPPSLDISGRKNTATTTTPSEDIVNQRTRKWVKRVLVEQGICPFTRSDRMSGQGLADLGVPVGSIAYHTSFHAHPIGLFADTWRAIAQMMDAGPNGRDGVSSILLAAPEFDDDFDLWSGPVFAMLEASVVAAQAEAQVGVVCFHPRYATPDGTSWPGFGHMHSVPRLEKWYREYGSPPAELTSEQVAAGGAWQRRTPHATINVLRADQLAIAESRRESGRLYADNIDKLVGISGMGTEKLEEDLQLERQYGIE